eukprot:686966-Pleurochrysis_carterae.AAC.1
MDIQIHARPQTIDRYIQNVDMDTGETWCRQPTKEKLLTTLQCVIIPRRALLRARARWRGQRARARMTSSHPTTIP